MKVYMPVFCMPVLTTTKNDRNFHSIHIVLSLCLDRLPSHFTTFSFQLVHILDCLTTYTTISSLYWNCSKNNWIFEFYEYEISSWFYHNFPSPYIFNVFIFFNLKQFSQGRDKHSILLFPYLKTIFHGAQIEIWTPWKIVLIIIVAPCHWNLKILQKSVFLFY